MTKKIPANKIQGNRGQEAFTAWIADAGVFSDKPAEDCGFDYLCNVTKTERGGGALMLGQYCAVSVRSTKGHKSYILIDRNDAELFLTSNLPCAIAIVKRGRSAAEAKVALRVVDVAFIQELDRFLSKQQAELSVRFDLGIEDPHKAVEEVRRLFQPGHAQRLAVARERHHLSRLVLDPRILLQSTDVGTRAVIATRNLASMFELTTGDTVRAYSDAVLGKQELLTERLASFRPKPALVDRIRGLADQVMLCGPTHSSLEHPVVLEASNKALTARLTCEWRETDDWTAYCHSSGLAIRISTQVYEQEGQQGREHGIGFDQSVRFSDIWGTEVESFMLNCHPDGSLFVSVEAEGSKIRGQLDGPALVQLAARGAASRATRVLREAGIVDMSGRSVESLTPDEFGTLLLLETAISGFDFLAGGGFALGETGWEKLLEESVRLRVPICGNLNGRGVVVWADVEGSLLWEPARKRICGLKFRKLIRHEIEWGDDVFRIGEYPEIKVCAAWPGIPANFVMDETVHVGPEDDWGVELAWEDLEPPSGGEAGSLGSLGPIAGAAGLDAALPKG